MNTFFTKNLLKWNAKYNLRAMPWKGEKDPYKIWLSEIILQQTRVEQGWNYYLKFINEFPTIHDLANAPEKKVFKLWEGLGYYSRCKNLIATAKLISRQLNGIFPVVYEDILRLKGVGPYTASAIASFAFNLPYAVVDGNVMRVIARVFGIDNPIDTTEGKLLFNRTASGLLDKKKPGLYNQAIMDFGATICKPQLPLCQDCIMQKDCKAYQSGIVDMLPVKAKQIIKKERWLYYLVVEYKKKLYVRQRTGRDIWQSLHEFLLVEPGKDLTTQNIQQLPPVKKLLEESNALITGISKEYTQQLTHQTLHGRFIEISAASLPKLEKDFKRVSYPELSRLAFPKFIITYLKEKNVNLSQH